MIDTKNIASNNGSTESIKAIKNKKNPENPILISENSTEYYANENFETLYKNGGFPENVYTFRETKVPTNTKYGNFSVSFKSDVDSRKKIQDQTYTVLDPLYYSNFINESQKNDFVGNSFKGVDTDGDPVRYKKEIKNKNNPPNVLIQEHPTQYESAGKKYSSNIFREKYIPVHNSQGMFSVNFKASSTPDNEKDIASSKIVNGFKFSDPKKTLQDSIINENSMTLKPNLMNYDPNVIKGSKIVTPGEKKILSYNIGDKFLNAKQESPKINGHPIVDSYRPYPKETHLSLFRLPFEGNPREKIEDVENHPKKVGLNESLYFVDNGIDRIHRHHSPSGLLDPKLKESSFFNNSSKKALNNLDSNQEHLGLKSDNYMSRNHLNGLNERPHSKNIHRNLLGVFDHETRLPKFTPGNIKNKSKTFRYLSNSQEMDIDSDHGRSLKSNEKKRTGMDGNLENNIQKNRKSHLKLDKLSIKDYPTVYSTNDQSPSFVIKNKPGYSSYNSREKNVNIKKNGIDFRISFKPGEQIVT
ncbi:hypothetical protein AYI68_g4000 [Smittium mucronatum]|uniref:Uncharacterized protein n=1 Tax=Smittium mucronatum TaxID=133383 RepID=A0A1R0GYG2_9FUNG|nr:hypothetical protein AYI68_g4000 [Smittium mucronatum]